MMERYEAYWHLHELFSYVGEQQQEALTIAMNDIEFVDLMPKDTAAVVRCKDCKHCDSARDCIHPENIHHYYDGEGYDYESFHMVDPDHFCSYGEKREADGNEQNP